MSKKQIIWIVAVFFLVLLPSLIVNIPARQLWKYVQLPSDIKIQGIQGSISSGTVKHIGYKTFHLRDVNFALQPSCFFKLAMCYQLDSDDKELLLNIDANLITQNLSVSDSTILLESSVLNDIPQLLAQPKGRFKVAIDRVTLIDTKINNLKTRVDWLGAGVQGEDQLLGNYTALITQEPDKLAVTLSDTDSLLALKGTIDLEWNGQYKVDLQLDSKPDLNRSVISVMEMMAKKSGLNQFTIKKTGRLPARSLKILASFESTQ